MKVKYRGEIVTCFALVRERMMQKDVYLIRGNGARTVEDLLGNRDRELIYLHRSISKDQFLNNDYRWVTNAEKVEETNGALVSHALKKEL